MVQFNDATEEEAVWGQIAGRSIPVLKFSDETPPGSGNYVAKPIGSAYQIQLTELPSRRQAIDYTTKVPKTFADGKPIYDIILTGQLLGTNVPGAYDPNDADDDGIRRLVCNQALRRALQDEVHRLGIQRFGVGSVLTITFVGFGTPKGGGRAPYRYEMQMQPAEYVAPQVAAVMADTPYPPNPNPVQVPPQAPQQAQPIQQLAPVAQPSVQQPVQPLQPIQAPVAPIQPVQQAPVQQAPVQQAPVQQAAPVDYAAVGAAKVAAVMGTSAPTAQVTEEHVAAYRQLQGSNVPHMVAIAAVAESFGHTGDPAFAAALEQAVA